MANRNNYALQISEEALTAELMNDLEAQDLSPAMPLDDNIKSLRDKIKSARLEKLMASQLETELDVAPEPYKSVLEGDNPGNYFDDEEGGEEFTDYPNAANSPVSSFSKKKELGSGIDGFGKNQNLNLGHSLRNAEMLCREISESMDLYSKLTQRAEALRGNLGEFETDLLSLEKAREEYEELNEAYQKLASKFNDRENSIEAQGKQIIHLEKRLDSTNGVLETTRDEFKKAKEAIALKENEIRHLKSRFSAAGEENRLLMNKIGQFEASLEEKAKKLDAARQKSIEDIDTIESLRDDISALNSEKHQLKTRLDDVQAKHDEFNRRGLEQQSNHHSRVHELERTIRQLQRDVDDARQDRAQAMIELKAANGLVAIHEEMLESLSTETK